MATTSYPAVGNGGLTETEWIYMHDAEDGIFEEYGSASLGLTRINTGNICRVATGSVRVNGYELRVTADEDLTCPTGAATYYIAAKYDPALNVADGSGNAATLGPCRLVIGSTLATGGGESYVLLYEIVRAAGQNLTDATLVDHRKWVSLVNVDWPWSTPNPPVGNLNRPRGSLRYDGTYDRLLVRTLVGSSLGWKEIGRVDPTTFPLASGLSGHNASPQYYTTAGRQVHLQGDVDRSSGANLGTGSSVTLGTMPVGLRPGATRGFVVKAFGNSTGTGRVEVTASGAVNLLSGAGQENIVWANLDGISYLAEG